jgi:hypothetical protein
MSEVRRADPAARRNAVLFVVLGALVGALLLLGFEFYRIPLREWVLSEPRKFGLRVKLVFLVLGVLLSAPLGAFAVYFCRLAPRRSAPSSFRHRGIGSFVTLLT